MVDRKVLTHMIAHTFLKLCSNHLVKIDQSDEHLKKFKIIDPAALQEQQAGPQDGEDNDKTKKKQQQRLELHFCQSPEGDDEPDQPDQLDFWGQVVDRKVVAAGAAINVLIKKGSCLPLLDEYGKPSDWMLSGHNVLNPERSDFCAAWLAGISRPVAAQAST